MQRKTPQRRKLERYDLKRSPLAQRPTQRKLASLLGESRDDLRRLVNYKDEFIVRRQIVTGKSGKLRDLAYPEGRLRAVHERMKFHLDKIKQPNYLLSPRRGRSQRDNAQIHIDQHQYLTLDLKKFYPSTTERMVYDWFKDQLGMYEDVAGLLTHLCTIDGKVSFGSPLTPVLCALLHRPMFDRVAKVCDDRGLQYSVWVDDLTISGKFVPGDVLIQIRYIIRECGLKSHSIAFRMGNRPVYITGIGVVGAHLVAPNALNIKIKNAWEEYHRAVTANEKDAACQRLLSNLGTVRHISGKGSRMSQKASDQMNSLRQERAARQKAAQLARLKVRADQPVEVPATDELPW